MYDKPVRTPLIKPDSNPTERLGARILPEGEGGLYSQTWFPICLSSELAVGQVRGENFLDGKVVVYRGADGVARVTGAYCPHVGADLSLGDVVENRLRCRFHKWEFAEDGRCFKTAIGDPAPKAARLYRFPVQERYGFVWAFNGDNPIWELPDFEFPDEELVARSYRPEDYINCDPWVFCCNTPDIQHFKVLHGVRYKTEDPHDEFAWSHEGLEYHILADHQDGTPISWKIGIRGTNFYWQEGAYGDFWLGALVSFGIPAAGKHQIFSTIFLKKGDGSPESEQRLEEQFAASEHLMYRTFGEDMDILNTIHYRPGALTKGDTSLSRYVEYLRKYPRAHPSAAFIR